MMNNELKTADSKMHDHDLETNRKGLCWSSIQTCLLEVLPVAQVFRFLRQSFQFGFSEFVSLLSISLLSLVLWFWEHRSLPLSISLGLGLGSPSSCSSTQRCPVLLCACSFGPSPRPKGCSLILSCSAGHQCNR